MNTRRMNAGDLAQKFHELYEQLAPSYGYETRKESAVPWAKVPEKNKTLMIAVCDLILEEVYQIEENRKNWSE